MNRISDLLIYGLMFLLLLTGCASPKNELAMAYHDLPSYDRSNAPASPARQMPADQALVKEMAAPELAAEVDESRPAADRILIYTAHLSMAVADVESSIAAVRRMAEQAGGYLQTLQNVSITIRVPAKQFQPILEQITQLGQTLEKNINVQDITDEYVDLQLRLKNLEAARDRLLAIMQKASEVKDILAVEKELTRLSEEIERIKGRLANLEKQVQFSTITVIFMQAGQGQASHRRPVIPFAWVNNLGIDRVLQMGR